jgi:GAF domain-containing protein
MIRVRSSRTDSSSNRVKSGRPDLRTELAIQSGRLDFLESALRGSLLKKATPAGFGRMLDKARSVLRAETAVLYLRSFVATNAPLLIVSPRSRVLSVAATKTLLRKVEDCLVEGDNGRRPSRLCGHPVRHMIVHPLEHNLGFLLALNKQDRPEFTANDGKFLEAFAAQTVMVLENLSLFNDAQNRIRELSVLIRSGQLASSTLELNVLLYKLIEEAKGVVGAQAGSVILHDVGRRQLVFYITVSHNRDELERITMPENKGIAGWVLRRKTACIVNDTKRDKRFFTGVDRATKMKTRSVLAVPIVAGTEAVGVIELINKKAGPFTDADIGLLSAIASHSAMSIRNARLFDRTRSLLLDTVSSLTQAIEAKDSYTAGHSDRVTYYCRLIARGLRLSRSERDKLRLAALLHDIGKIGIREEILMKPGRLTDEEFEVIRKHPVIGERILKHIEEIKDILPGIRNHHERLDGKGYPDRQRGSGIALLGRIIAVADAFDAMTSDRPYRGRMTHEEAVAELVSCSGTQFDAAVVRAFVHQLRKEKLVRSRT